MNNRFNLIKIFEAIESDDYLAVRSVLHDNSIAITKIPSKQLCGLAILAAESNAINVTQEFSYYNNSVNDSNLSKYVSIALKICGTNKSMYKSITSKMLH